MTRTVSGSAAAAGHGASDHRPAKYSGSACGAGIHQGRRHWVGRFDATICAMTPRSAILAGVLLAATAHPTSFQQQSSFESDAPVGDIMQRVVDRVVDQEERGVELRYESRIVTQVDTLDKAGAVTKTEITLHRRYRLKESCTRS